MLDQRTAVQPKLGKVECPDPPHRDARTREELADSAVFHSYLAGARVGFCRGGMSQRRSEDEGESRVAEPFAC